MNTILAQSTTVSGGQMASAICAIGAALVLPVLRDWMKDRREREKEKHESETASRQHEQSQKYQERIASSNERMEKSLSDLAREMAVQTALGNERHTANITSMKAICRADCKNYQHEKANQSH